MTFADLIKQILRSHPEGMTPQQIRDVIKTEHADFYGTPSHRRNVEKGNYKDLDHALLAQIYVASRSAKEMVVDRTQKPIRLVLNAVQNEESSIPDEEIDSRTLRN